MKKLQSFKGGKVKNFRGVHSIIAGKQKFIVTIDKNNQVCDIQPREVDSVNCLSLTRGTGLRYAENILTEYYGCY